MLTLIVVRKLQVDLSVDKLSHLVIPAKASQINYINGWSSWDKHMLYMFYTPPCFTGVVYSSGYTLEKGMLAHTHFTPNYIVTKRIMDMLPYRITSHYRVSPYGLEYIVNVHTRYAPGREGAH